MSASIHRVGCQVGIWAKRATRDNDWGMVAMPVCHGIDENKAGSKR
ncbi:MAG: hypothetical protein ISN28_06685 [Ectothiorhodospiraceae bacterium AqS1]|nr:hypothetical protein [Ectothiorhodospiraceae bacterium AqS1]